MRKAFSIAVLLLLLVSCARMGQPDGGWFDETPPKVVFTFPDNKDVNVSTKKIRILFDEFVKIDNAQENVIISPAQVEQPDIKAKGKAIVVELKDTLKENTTYTIDFSDAITDNNESNPLGNYTYSFSTGDHIDTLEVAGYILNAEDLEPVKGITVGLYDNLADSALATLPMLRVSRTDSRGHFVIKGVAPGTYRIAALQDMDADFKYSQRAEQVAFSHDTIAPFWKPDTRQDTIWADSLHIRSIERVKYTHFLPDEVCLRAFTAKQTDHFLVKTERTEANRLGVYYSSPFDTLPVIKGLNFKADSAFIIESSLKNDTIIYWLRDTTLVNTDTLQIELRHMITDTLGVLQEQTDTFELIPRVSYKERLKRHANEIEKWEKDQNKRKKRGLSYDSIYTDPPMKIEMKSKVQLDPDGLIQIYFGVPLASIDTSAIHLYVKQDTLWNEQAFTFEAMQQHRTYALHTELEPDTEYSLEIDSLAFYSIYGLGSDKLKNGIKVKSLDEYSTFVATIEGFNNKNIVVQMLNGSDKVVKEVSTQNGTARFENVTPDTYYLRMFEDLNNNGVWDTGDYDIDLAPEPVYYFNEEVECRAKWDVTRTWNPLRRKLFQQKPSKITKQKGERQKTISQRNLERARKLGIEPPDN